MTSIKKFLSRFHFDFKFYLAWAAGIPILLSAAFYNSYPLVFTDSFTYINSAFLSFHVPFQRSFYYGLLIRFCHIFSDSLWMVVLFQSAMCIYLLLLLLKEPIRAAGYKYFFALLFFLTIYSSLPWFVGQVMPDYFTGILCILLYVMLFDWDVLSFYKKCFFSFFFIFTLAMHYSHYPITVTILFCCALTRVMTKNIVFKWAQIGFLSFLTACSIGVMFATNKIMINQYVFSRSGHIFLMGRLAQDGVIYKLLTEHCDEYKFQFCEFTEDFKDISAAKYVWWPSSPRRKIGRRIKSKIESKRVILASLRHYPWEHIKTAVNSSYKQFKTSETGDGLNAKSAWLIQKAIRIFYGSERSTFSQTKQIRGQLTHVFFLLNKFHAAAFWISFILLLPCIYLIFKRKENPREIVFGFLVFLFVSTNAVICGIFSGPFGRYQSRVAWLFPLALFLLFRIFPFAKTYEWANKKLNTNLMSEILNKLHDILFFQGRIAKIIHHLSTLLPNKPMTGLDIGCGSGLIALKFMHLRKNVSLEGLDVLVREKSKIPVRQFDGKKIPLGNKTVDFTLLIDVLHHTEKPEELLRECVRVSREFVVIKDHILTDWRSKVLLRAMDWVGNKGHKVALPYNYLSAEKWRELFSQLNIVEVEKISDLGLYPIPLHYIFDSDLHFFSLLKIDPSH